MRILHSIISICSRICLLGNDMTKNVLYIPCAGKIQLSTPPSPRYRYRSVDKVDGRDEIDIRAEMVECNHLLKRIMLHRCMLQTESGKWRRAATVYSLNSEHDETFLIHVRCAHSLHASFVQWIYTNSNNSSGEKEKKNQQIHTGVHRETFRRNSFNIWDAIDRQDIE